MAEKNNDGMKSEHELTAEELLAAIQQKNTRPSDAHGTAQEVISAQDDDEIDVQELLRRYLPEEADPVTEKEIGASVQKSTAESATGEDELSFTGLSASEQTTLPADTAKKDNDVEAAPSSEAESILNRLKMAAVSAESPDASAADELAAPDIDLFSEISSEDAAKEDELSGITAKEESTPKAAVAENTQASSTPDASLSGGNGALGVSDETNAKTGADNTPAAVDAPFIMEDEDDFEYDILPEVSIFRFENVATPTEATPEAESAAPADVLPGGEQSSLDETAPVDADEEALAEDAQFIEEHTSDESLDEFNEFADAVYNESEEGIDDTDFNLMLAFGLEDELAEKVGSETATKLTEDYEAQQQELEEKEKKKIAYEYRDRSQNAEIAAHYKKNYRNTKIKLALAALFAVLLLVYENLPLITGQPIGGFVDYERYPVVYVMVDLQILLIACAFAYRQIFDGFRGIFTGKPTSDSITSLMSLFAVIYSAITAQAIVPPNEPKMFSFTVAFACVASLFFTYLNIKREIFSFNIVSSKKPKYVLRHLSARDAVLESEAFGEKPEDIGDILKIEKTSFVDGYFYRTNDRCRTNSSFVSLTFVLSLILSALISVYYWFDNGGGLLGTVQMFFIASTASLPMSMLLTFVYPFFKANSDSYDNDSTIIGENSLAEYSSAALISFDDDNVFPSTGVRVQNIRVYENYRIDRALYYAASVFARTGGPLCDVFEVATMEMGHSDDVEIIEVGDGFIDTVVNKKSIVFGKAEALRAKGIELPEDITDEDEELESELSVMYMIYQGKMVAKMLIKYQIDADFEFIMKQLSGSGMYVCVRTFDPNIDEKLIGDRVNMNLDRYPLRVVKYHTCDERNVYSERAEGGVVSRGTSKSLLQTVTYCDKVLSVKKTNSTLSLLAIVMTMVILTLILISGNFGILSSLLIAANQLFWMLPALLTSKLIVG